MRGGGEEEEGIEVGGGTDTVVKVSVSLRVLGRE